MKYKAIIFDMDGTIIDSNDVWSAAMESYIKDQGIAYTKKLVKELTPQVCGLGLPESSKVMKSYLKLEHTPYQIEQEMTRRAVILLEQKIRFIDGFVEFHKLALSHGLKTGIATNADDDSLAVAKRTMDLKQFFGTHIYSISDVDNICKPKPDLYLHAAQKMGVDPKDCVAIEDSSHGIKAAVAADMLCFGINTGKDHSLLQDAHVIIEGYHEIDMLRLLGKSPSAVARDVLWRDVSSKF
jgi:beta-phosphoglucomutase-like phosphatase (HAD superfamily)